MLLQIAWSLFGLLLTTVIGNNFLSYTKSGILMVKAALCEYKLPRCGNVAAILELDEHLDQHFKIFEAAPQESRGVPSRNPAPDYFL